MIFVGCNMANSADDTLTFFNQPALLLDESAVIYGYNKFMADTLFASEMSLQGQSFIDVAERFGLEDPLPKFLANTEHLTCVIKQTISTTKRQYSYTCMLKRNFIDDKILLLFKSKNTARFQFIPDIFNISLQQLGNFIIGNVYWMDSERYYLGPNHANLLSFGIKREDFVGRRAEDIFPDDIDTDMIVKTDNEILRTGKSKILEERYFNKHGEKTTYLTFKTVIKSTEGKVLGLFGHSIDLERFGRAQREFLLKQQNPGMLTSNKLITASQMTMQVQASEQDEIEDLGIKNIQTIHTFLQSIVNCMPGTVYWMDDTRHYLGCNQNMAELFGLQDSRESVGKTAYDFIDKERAKIIDKIDSKVLETGKSFQIEEIIGNGQVYVSYKSPIFSAENKVIGMVGISLDITKQKKTEAALKRAKTIAEKANQAKSDFLAMMTHELRTPLNIILGMTRIMQQEDLPADKREHYLQTVFNSGQALLHLINNVLDFSKAQSGKLELNNDVFSPREVLTQLQDELGYKAAERGLACSFTVDDQLPEMLYGDDQRLRQVLYNLIDNALKYTQKGSVTVSMGLYSVKNEKMMVDIKIKDTGIGIPKDRLNQVFTAFSQVRSKKHNEYSRKYGGVGLGLAIVSRMVEVLKGRMFVESEEGKGTEFLIQVPFEKARDRKLRKEILAQELPENFPGMRVLLVEDNLLNQKVVSHMLNTLKCEINVASNGEEALALLKNKEFDVVLMDLSLPDMSGLEITRIYREQEKDKRLPIVALTAHAHSDDEEKSLAAGMDDFLVKPLFPEKLREVLASIKRS